jgi:hypothetical protein
METNQHFGNLVNEVLSLKKITLADAASYASIPQEKLKMMLSSDEWTSPEIKHFSVALNYDFGKHLSQWDIAINAEEGRQEVNFYITYNAAQDGDKLDELNIAVRKLCDDLRFNCQ